MNLPFLAAKQSMKDSEQLAAWATNRRSWKPLHSWEIMIQLQLHKHGGMTHATGVLQWMTINTAEGIGKEGEAVG